ncbi:MAG: spermidine synthase [Verrucomicrobiota bacterium]|nr:spermidine synthase [Verrucomicrobiota bacterium]
MSKNFEVLDAQETVLGEVMLRRRRLLSLDVEVFEVKLRDEFLMSSMFHEVEEALARFGLAEVTADPCDVVVGGLGLGYTAAAVLEHAKVRSLAVVEFLQPVIGWHRDGLVPLGPALCGDARCQLWHADFFAAALSAEGFDAQQPGRQWDAVLLDIDHSPRALLHTANAAFYQPAGLQALARHLVVGGVFGLWSDDPPDDEFMEALGAAFDEVRAHVVTFENPLLESTSASTVYTARKPAAVS